jgi:hypothetical protein
MVPECPKLYLSAPRIYLNRVRGARLVLWEMTSQQTLPSPTNSYPGTHEVIHNIYCHLPCNIPSCNSHSQHCASHGTSSECFRAVFQNCICIKLCLYDFFALASVPPDQHVDAHQAMVHKITSASPVSHHCHSEA